MGREAASCVRPLWAFVSGGGEEQKGLFSYVVEL